MDSSSFFRGTSSDQDPRFRDKQKKLMSETKFPTEVTKDIDFSKVKLPVLKPWVSKRIVELMYGVEDELLISYVFELLEDGVEGKEMYIHLKPFLEERTDVLMKELWNLLDSAQQSISGIPKELLEKEKKEALSKVKESNDIKGQILKRKKEQESKHEQSSNGKDNHHNDLDHSDVTKSETQIVTPTTYSPSRTQSKGKEKDVTSTQMRYRENRNHLDDRQSYHRKYDHYDNHYHHSHRYNDKERREYENRSRYYGTPDKKKDQSPYEKRHNHGHHYHHHHHRSRDDYKYDNRRYSPISSSSSGRRRGRQSERRKQKRSSSKSSVTSDSSSESSPHGHRSLDVKRRRRRYSTSSSSSSSSDNDNEKTILKSQSSKDNSKDNSTKDNSKDNFKEVPSQEHSKKKESLQN